MSDQPVNAEQVVRLGLGKVLDYRAISPARLKETAFSILSDEDILRNVCEMKRKMMGASGNAGAVSIIAAFMDL